MAVVVSLGTTAAFSLHGIAMTHQEKVLACTYEAPTGDDWVGVAAHIHNEDCYAADGTLLCPLEEIVPYVHDASCYETVKALTCGLEETAGHIHTDACYERTRGELICEQEFDPHVHNADCYERVRGELLCTDEGEEHEHTDDCYAWQEDLTCTKEQEPHIHTDDCYAWSSELVCGAEAGEGAHVHTEDCYSSRTVLICEKQAVHEHDASCYDPDGALICGQKQMPVHVHGDSCFTMVELSDEEIAQRAEAEKKDAPVSDPGADLESEGYWTYLFSGMELSTDWAKDLVNVARSQLGYPESKRNFELAEDQSLKGYTRYGAWYGIPYGDWCAMFVSFCLRYAEIPETAVPRDSGCATWVERLSAPEFALYARAEAYQPKAGDIIFFDFNNDEKADHVGLVSMVDEDQGTLETIEGNRVNYVERFTYNRTDPSILGYGVLPKNPDQVDAPQTVVTLEDRDEDAYTGPSFDGEAAGMKIHVETREGTFPANIRMVVETVDTETVMEAVSGAVNKGVVGVQAVDIKFLDADDVEIEPALPVRVTMEPAEAADGAREQVVLHVEDSGAVSPVDEPQKAGEKMTFETGGFSVYVLVFTEGEEDETGERYTGIYTYESDSLSARVRITDREEIPETAELVVTPLTPDMEAYAAYMEALNRDFEQEVYNSENSLLYDVTVLVDGKVFEPRKGNVEVSLTFKDKQLSESLGLDADSQSALRIIHLPVLGDGQPGVSPDAAAAGSEAPKPEDIRCEYVPGAQVDLDEAEAVSFSLGSLSVITVTRASTDVTVNASLLGTDMKSLGYNLYAYLAASNDSTVYGAKIDFSDGNATATIPNVPVNSYRLYLVYGRSNQTLQVPTWNYNNVLDSNTNIWVDADGQYIFGYSAQFPADTTVTPDNHEIGVALEVSDIQSTMSVSSLMDRAIQYGITADHADLPNNCYTSFAVKDLVIANQNTETYYGPRSEGIDVVSNIAAAVTNDGQPLTTEANQAAAYYVTDADKGKVNSTNQEETIVRNKNELEDRVEIMLNNTLRQCSDLVAQSALTIPAGLTSVDVSPYAENATIILDATSISGEPNGFTIVKRPGQTVVFNIGGQNAAPPANIKIKLVNENGQQIDAAGNLTDKLYRAGDEMKNAPRSDGDVWNKVVWNFPDVTGTVMANNPVGGIFLVPQGSFQANDKGGGWVVARNTVKITNEWYGFPGTDEPFKQKIIRKTFVGVTENEIRDDYVVKVWTHTNDSTSGTTNEQLITTLVMKEKGDASLIIDPTGATDQTGYLTKGTDADGNLVIEWQTPPLSVGNEHKLTEEHTASTNPDKHLDLIEFKGPYSVWSDAAQDYVWIEREFSFDNEADFAGIFNVSRHNDDYRLYSYITNYYNMEITPHDLTLTKAVVDPENLAEAEQEYHFELELKNRDETTFTEPSVRYRLNGGEEQTLAVTDGKVTLSLKKEDTIRLIGLPFGTRYTIKEIDVPEKCAVTFSGDSEETLEVSGVLLKDHSYTATNTFSDDPGVPVTAHKDLVDGVLQGGDFTFRLVDGSGHLVQEVTNDANGDIPFTTLVFAEDGSYDYRLYEVADESKPDVVYDTTEYVVHLTVTGGRVREVTYTNGATGVTSADTPMFRNRQLNPETDTLKARKVFIDEATGKAIPLQAGDFSFTAVSTDAVPIVYNGTNDAEGFVTFTDASGNPVDLDEMTQPTTFIIRETTDQYGGTLTEGQEIAYDDGEYRATANVTIETVTTNPVQVSAQGNDATVSITFTPSVAAQQYYFTQPNGGAAVVVPRSDGSVTMNISISKNQTQNPFEQYHDIDVEYGTGQYYGTHGRLGSITIRAKSGNWGGTPIEVQSVRVDGNPLSSITTTQKTVELVYEAGPYPVFVNKLSAPEESTVDFPFTKVWVDNVSYANPQPWEIGKEITVTLNGTFQPEETGAAGSTAEYTFKIKYTGGDPAFAYTQPAGDDAPQIEGSQASPGENLYGFVITGLPGEATVAEKKGQWTYCLQEEAIGGYVIGYGSWDSTQGKAVPDPTIQARGIESGGTLINAKVMVELPKTGGVGTSAYIGGGLALVLTAASALCVSRIRRRHWKEGDAVV
ncbi:MAG: CHAP domain-containing protein [Oscillospiraceae bacterium]|nr:CHAP domain-containing protein [Oscillospiraceae bacterium]